MIKTYIIVTKFMEYLLFTEVLTLEPVGREGIRRGNLE